MRPRAWGRRAKQPCHTQRRVPKHSLEPRGPRGAPRGATGGAAACGGRRGVEEGRRARRLSSPGRPARRAPPIPGGARRLPRWPRRPARRGGARRSGAQARGPGPRLPGRSAGRRLGLRRPGLPLGKPSARRPVGAVGAVGAERLGRPRARGACGLRRETCALVTGTRAAGARS